MNDKSKALFLMVVLCIVIVLGLGSITRGRETVKFTGKVGGKLLGGGHQVRVIRVYHGNIQAGENLQVKYVDRHGDLCPNAERVDRGDKVKVYGELKNQYSSSKWVDVCPYSYYIREIEGQERNLYELSAFLEAEDLSIGDTVTLKVHVNRILFFDVQQETKSGDWDRIKSPEPRGREKTYEINFSVKPFEGTHHIRIRAGAKAKHKKKSEEGSIIKKILKFEVERENKTPTARCDYSPSDPETGEEITFSGSDSYDSDGYIERYDWNFDSSLGGLLSDEQGETVSHTFDDPGSHKVHLEVNDNDGATDSTTCSVKVEEENEEPTAKCEVSPNKAAVGESVSFDASDSYDPENQLSYYRWDFDNDGDIDTTGKYTTHEFENPGRRRVRLEVVDYRGAKNSTICSVRVEEKRGKISVSVENKAGETIDSHIYLDDEFKGGTGPDGAKVISIDSGSYEIKATKSGYKSSKKKVYLSLGEKEEVALTLEKKNKPPNVNFIFSPASPKTNQTVTFNSLSRDPDGTIEEYSWTFGDDSSSLAKNPTHEYSKPGTYIIKLTVTDNEDASDESARHKIIVRSTWAQAYRQHKRNPAVFLEQQEIESKIQYWKKTYDILKGSKVAAHLTEGAIDIWKIWVNLSLEANPSFNSINGAITETVQGVTSLNGVRGEYAQTLREVSHLSEFAFKGVDNLEKLGDVQQFATKVASTASSAGSIQKAVKNAFQSSDVTELKGLGSIAATKTIDVLTDADLNLFQQVSFSEMIHIGADLMVLRKLFDVLQNLKGDPTKEEILRYYSLLRVHYKLRQTSLGIYASYRQKIEEKDWWEAPLTKLSDHIHEALGTEISGSEELQDLAKLFSRRADKTVLELGKIASSATK